LNPIKLQAGNKQYLLSLSEEGFKLYNDTDGLGYEISLPCGLAVTHDSDKLQISNQGDKTASTSQKITIPYGTDLTDYNKYAFRQSIIDNIIMGNPYGNLYDKITDGQKYPVTIKTLVGDDIYPKTTNTIFTLYYSSYIDTVEGKNTYLLDYNTNSATSYAVITISISKTSPPQLVLSINYTSSSEYKKYVVTQDTPKVTVDLTADLEVARPGEEITSFKFRKSDTPG
jgi:hypothetical protein